jgi:hypothetical protein
MLSFTPSFRAVATDRFRLTTYDVQARGALYHDCRPHVADLVTQDGIDLRTAAASQVDQGFAGATR